MGWPLDHKSKPEHHLPRCTPTCTAWPTCKNSPTANSRDREENKGIDGQTNVLNPKPQKFSDMEDEEGKGEEDVTEKTQLVDEDVEKTEGWPGDTIEKEPEAGGRKTGSGQRSVAFHLGEEQLGQTVGGRELDGSEGRSDIGEEGGLANSEKLQRKESIGTSVKKEIIGILKPPNPRKELKSFPSLPECFLHDLGLIENIALE